MRLRGGVRASLLRRELELEHQLQVRGVMSYLLVYEVLCRYGKPNRCTKDVYRTGYGECILS